MRREEERVRVAVGNAVREAEEAVRRGDFAKALARITEGYIDDPGNPALIACESGILAARDEWARKQKEEAQAAEESTAQGTRGRAAEATRRGAAPRPRRARGTGPRAEEGRRRTAVVPSASRPDPALQRKVRPGTCRSRACLRRQSIQRGCEATGNRNPHCPGSSQRPKEGG